MKKYLKDFILTEAFVEKSILSCLDPTSKRKNRWKRHDTSELIAEYLVKDGYPAQKQKKLAKEIYEQAQIDYLMIRPFSSLLAKYIYSEIKSRTIELKPIRNVVRYDTTCGKKRIIGIASMKQQVLDWITSDALDKFFEDKIHPCQESGIVYRGPLHAAKRVSKWIDDDAHSMKYCIQGDVKKFYPSIDHDVLKNIFSKYVANDDILYLLDLLIDSYGKRGICIGSYLALRMGNALMGMAMYWLEEHSFYYRKNGKRKGKRFSHMIVYTDNITLFGANKTQLRHAMQDLAEYLCLEYKLIIKSPWVFRSLPADDFYDVAGFKIYADHITIRKRTFKRTRNQALKNKKEFDPSTARSVTARWGSLKNTDSYYFCKKYKYFKSLSLAKEVIRNEAKNAIP